MEHRTEAGAMLWTGFALGIAIRLVLIAAHAPALLGRSAELATPVNGLHRLAEGFWLKKSGISPYAGGAYHGSPLLLTALGPILKQSSIIFVLADVIGGLMLRSMGQILGDSRIFCLEKLGLSLSQENKKEAGTFAALFYLLNPFTILTCVGGSSSPLDNMFAILSLYGALKGNTPLAAFGCAIATHLSLYPAVLYIPVALALCAGPDRFPTKLFSLQPALKSMHTPRLEREHGKLGNSKFLSLLDFITWSAIWWFCLMGLCSLALRPHSDLHQMFTASYGFTLHVKDLTPNIGLFWYFFAEVFEFFRPFFLVVFHGNILCMIAPLSIRLHYRPAFLAYILLSITGMLKSYPSVGDIALNFALMGLFFHELSGFRYALLVLNGYICIAMLGPVMYTLWIWRGTGNSNFYYASTLVYALIQTIVLNESVSSIIRYERSLKLQLKSKLGKEKASHETSEREEGKVQ